MGLSCLTLILGHFPRGYYRELRFKNTIISLPHAVQGLLGHTGRAGGRVHSAGRAGDGAPQHAHALPPQPIQHPPSRELLMEGPDINTYQPGCFHAFPRPKQNTMAGMRKKCKTNMHFEWAGNADSAFRGALRVELCGGAVTHGSGGCLPFSCGSQRFPRCWLPVVDADACSQNR